MRINSESQSQSSATRQTNHARPHAACARRWRRAEPTLPAAPAPRSRRRRAMRRRRWARRAAYRANPPPPRQRWRARRWQGGRGAGEVDGIVTRVRRATAARPSRIARSSATCCDRASGTPSRCVPSTAASARARVCCSRVCASPRAAGKSSACASSSRNPACRQEEENVAENGPHTLSPEACPTDSRNIAADAGRGRFAVSDPTPTRAIDSAGRSAGRTPRAHSEASS